MFRRRMSISSHMYAAATILTGVLLLSYLSLSALGAAAAIGPLDAADASALDDLSISSDCTPITTHVADLDRIPAGETLSLTLTVSSGCPDRTPAVHVAVVIDATTDRSGLEDVKESAERFIKRVVKSSRPLSLATVIEIKSSARRVCPLTNDLDTAVACLNRVRAGSGPSRTDLGIKEAVATLRRARSSVDPGRPIHEAFYLWTNAIDENCSTIEREAQAAARVGVSFSARCAASGSADCDSQCVADIRSHNEGSMNDAYLSPALVPRLRLLALLVTDTFASNMQFVEGSARPAPSSVAPDRSAVPLERSQGWQRDVQRTASAHGRGHLAGQLRSGPW